MSGSKYTPGPLRVIDDLYNEGSLRVVSATGLEVARVHSRRDDETAKANAALIAKAPEMAERIAELEDERAQVDSYLPELYETDADGKPIEDLPRPMVERAYAAAERVRELEGEVERLRHVAREEHWALCEAKARRDELLALLSAATPEEMGGTPDLFSPEGGWDAWEEKVRTAMLRPPGSALADLRPELRAFARAMEARLRANDHKPGWKADDPAALWDRLAEESRELFDALAREATSDEIEAQAADVANFAMMVADVARLRAEATEEGGASS